MAGNELAFSLSFNPTRAFQMGFPHLATNLGITLNSAQWACWTGFYVCLLLLCNAPLGCPNTSLVTHCGYGVTLSHTVPGTIFFFSSLESLSPSFVQLRDPL